ncbi:type II toxin-antitoxin system VapC family toxin [Petrimonas sp.]|uniref:type II toxin-antitoxin system VapC family toxin n=1 Tax=Petrimonas sp. TaxID=2023866 RepID=UPI003F516865
MEKVFVDTNIAMDLLQKRDGFYADAQDLFTLADKKEVELYVSALTIATTHYLLRKHYNTINARKIVAKFKLLVSVLSVGNKEIDLALVSDFDDFEDAIQYHTAIENGMNAIITRNKKDFKFSALPVLTAKEWLARLFQT